MPLKLSLFPNFLALIGVNNDISTLGSLFSSISSDITNLWTYLDANKNVLDDEPGLPSRSAYRLNASNIASYSTIGNSGITSINPKLFNVSANRPYSVYEVLSIILDSIDPNVSSPTVTTVINTIKTKIGMNIFDSMQSSAVNSVDDRINKLTKDLKQITADVYNAAQSVGTDLTGYTFNQNGKQTKASTIVDRLIAIESAIVTMQAQIAALQA